MALLAAMLPELAVGLAGLAQLELRGALGLLRVPRVLGPGRALQLLVGCCHPLALGQPDLAAESGDGRPDRGSPVAPRLVWHWLDFPGAKYQRTASLRARLSEQGHRSWRNGVCQAVLGLESD